MGQDPRAAGDADLDALIGEIRREAARRRAAPDYPIDEEAALDAELDAQGPAGPGGADLAAVTAELRRLSTVGKGTPDAPGASEVAGLAASALTALAVRLTDLERRSRVGGSAAADAAAPSARATTADPASWRADIESALPAEGRVLVAGEGVAGLVSELAAGAGDVYGVDPSLEAFGDHGPVRSGDVLGHLRAVDSDALALAVLVGPVGTADTARIAHWAEELARCAARVEVWSEAPWAWRDRLGEQAADLAASRPLSPETWVAVLSRCGYTATARYGPGGRDYRVTAERGGATG